MEKIKITLNSQTVEKFEFQGQNIEVLPYVSLEDKIILYTNYIDSLFQDKKEGDFDCINYIEAEYSLILGIVDKNTNVDINSVKVDDILNSGLWGKILYHIRNYFEIRNDVDELVHRMDERKSVGNVLDNLANKVNLFLDNISKMDMSAEGLDKLQGLLLDSKAQVKAINDVVENPVKIPVKRKAHATKAK